MRLLNSTLPRGSGVSAPGGWFTLLVCLFVAVLEVCGRFATNDLQDFLALCVLAAGAVLVAMRHYRSPLGWVSSLVRWVKRTVGAVVRGYEFGIDLRGTPPLPRRSPPAVWLLAGGLLAWSAGAVALWLVFPTGWRTVGQYSSYTAYLLVLALIWAVLLVVTFVGVFVPVAVLDKLLKRWLGDTDRRGAELAAVVGYAVLVSAVAWVVPPAAVLVLCGLVAGASVVAYLLPVRDGAALLWRRGAGRPVYAVPVRRVLALSAGLVSLLLAAVLLTACGGRLLGPPHPEDAMPVTALFGSVAAWLVPGLAGVVGVRLAQAVRHDPARRTPPTAHLAGDDPRQLRWAARIVRSWGWQVVTAPARRTRDHVGLVVVPPELSEADEFDPRWPLRVSVADLRAGAVRSRLQRRDEIQLRRQLIRGLQKLFKRAAAFKGPGGGGFWLAPHWWFVEGLGREDADASGPDSAPPLVGPPYHQMIPARARQHAHAVLRATHVDMIFVEDGVTFKNLERVLRVILELYDVHGGRRRAEEHHFRGVPRVKVMLHEYQPGNPFRSDVYPEPKFDDLSRVRVLHIFRDRGGQEEWVEPPAEFSWTPAPALTG